MREPGGDVLKVGLEPDRVDVGQETEAVLRLVNAGTEPLSRVQLSFSFPPEVVVLGRKKVELARLDGGSAWEHPVKLKAQRAGDYPLQCASCTYYHRGRMREAEGATVLLRAEAYPKPVLRAVRRRTGAEGAERLEGELLNTGAAAAGELRLGVEGAAGARAERALLGPGERWPFGLLMGARGVEDALVVRLEYREGEQSRQIRWRVPRPASKLAGAMRRKVFVSYAREDLEEFVWPLVQRLAEEGIPLWIDKQEIRPGDLWPLAIEEALDSCHCMVLCLSPHAGKSHWVREEVARFHSCGGKEIIPVLCREADRWLGIHTLEYVHYADFERVVERLGVLVA
jgi:hypothetical protein